MSNIKKLDQVGDTIVEVLLAVVVVGMAIGLGYSVATRSLKANRQAQERTEALKHVENQIERLKQLATVDSATAFQAVPFCLVDGAGKSAPRQVSLPPPLATDPLSNANYAGGECVTAKLYHLSIVPIGSRQFEVKARWPSLGKSGKEEVVVNYRLYRAP